MKMVLQLTQLDFDFILAAIKEDLNKDFLVMPDLGEKNEIAEKEDFTKTLLAHRIEKLVNDAFLEGVRVGQAGVQSV